MIAADELGKYKMVLQSIAIQGLLIHYTYFHIDFFAAGQRNPFQFPAEIILYAGNLASNSSGMSRFE